MPAVNVLSKFDLVLFAVGFMFVGACAYAVAI
jgi:hypothetical protein